jgi:hypothetical protein
MADLTKVAKQDAYNQCGFQTFTQRNQRGGCHVRQTPQADIVFVKTLPI